MPKRPRKPAETVAKLRQAHVGGTLGIPLADAALGTGVSEVAHPASAPARLPR